MGNRNVTVGGNLTGSSIVTGNGNVVTTTFTKTTLPPAESVDMVAEVAALRALLAEIASDDRLVIDNAMAEADHHLGKAEPDKDAIGGALERAIGYAGKAADFADKVDKLAPHVRNACAWLGENWHKLLGLVGLVL
jgi:hypothetical protein